MLRRVVVEGVFVAAENVDGVSADAQARSGEQTVVDSVAHGRIRRTGPFCTEIALGGKTSHQIIASGNQGRDRALRHRLLNGLQVLSARMQEKVDVRVDQAGQERCVAEVDNLRSGRTLYGRTNL
jgi:hypothetical protein